MQVGIIAAGGIATGAAVIIGAATAGTDTIITITGGGFCVTGTMAAGVIAGRGAAIAT
jgi:hypothetical protein